MSGPRITDAAVEAGARALHAADGTSSFDEWDGMADHERGWFREEARTTLTAALPHIRRAVIEELVAKYEAEAEAIVAKYPDQKIPGDSHDGGLAVQAIVTAGRLRAELEGDDHGYE